MSCHCHYDHYWSTIHVHPLVKEAEVIQDIYPICPDTSCCNPRHNDGCTNCHLHHHHHHHHPVVLCVSPFGYPFVNSKHPCNHHLVPVPQPTDRCIHCKRRNRCNHIDCYYE